VRLGRLTVFVLILLGLFAGTVFAKTATVEIKPTKDGSPVSGMIRFKEAPEGLKVNAEVKGVSPGKHGFHIHETGACTDEGKAAGGHFNPDQVSHGLLVKDGFSRAHAGDLGNIEVGADGTDDFGQPTGNAGGRIGCGVI